MPHIHTAKNGRKYWHYLTNRDADWTDAELRADVIKYHETEESQGKLAESIFKRVRDKAAAGGNKAPLYCSLDYKRLSVSIDDGRSTIANSPVLAEADVDYKGMAASLMPAKAKA
jgi:hypothetical protein